MPLAYSTTFKRRGYLASMIWLTLSPIYLLRATLFQQLNRTPKPTCISIFHCLASPSIKIKFHSTIRIKFSYYWANNVAVLRAGWDIIRTPYHGK